MPFRALLALLFAILAVADDRAVRQDDVLVHPRFEARALGFVSIVGWFMSAEASMQADPLSHLANLDVRIDLASLDTGSSERNATLKGPDFFDVAHYPYAIVTAHELPLDGNAPFDLPAVLDMHGVSKPLTLHVAQLHCEQDTPDSQANCRAQVGTALSRREWGMAAYSLFVSDTVKIDIDVEFRR
jgi:polyisoprenoid-binding protein YceI